MNNNITKIIVMILSLVIAAPSFAVAQSLHCDIAKKTWCDVSGCKSADENNEYVIIDYETTTYKMCEHEKENCQNLDIKNVEKSGIFIKFFFAGSSFAKVSLEDEHAINNIDKYDFMEVRDNLLGSMLSFGKCKDL